MISCSGLKTSLTIECVMRLSIPAAPRPPPPPPPPPGYCGALANFVLPRAICQPWGYSQAFDTYAVQLELTYALL